MTAAHWTRRFRHWPLVPCPLHSFAKEEHSPAHPYPLLDDVLNFPSISPGARTGRFFVIGCLCTEPLRHHRFRTLGQAQKAWRGTAKRLLQ